MARPPYPGNSPETSARVLAALVVGDDGLDAPKVDFLHRSGALGMVGIGKASFMEVLSAYLGETLGRCAGGSPSGTNRWERLDADLTAIDDRDKQLVLAAVIFYLSEAEGLRTGARDVMQHACHRWRIDALELERQLRVSRERSRSAGGPTRRAGWWRLA